MIELIIGLSLGLLIGVLATLAYWSLSDGIARNDFED